MTTPDSNMSTTYWPLYRRADLDHGQGPSRPGSRTGPTQELSGFPGGCRITDLQTANHPNTSGEQLPRAGDAARIGRQTGWDGAR